MKIQQISIFLENKPGRLNAICRALAENQISIVTLSLADTQQFGILRLIIEDWQRAQQVLEEAGYVVNVREVVAVTVPDRPGGMAEVVDVVSAAGVNIAYAYAFTARRGTAAVLIFRFDNPDAAVNALKAAGRDILHPDDLFKNSGADA